MNSNGFRDVPGTSASKGDEVENANAQTTSADVDQVSGEGAGHVGGEVAKVDSEGVDADVGMHVPKSPPMRASTPVSVRSATKTHATSSRSGEISLDKLYVVLCVSVFCVLTLFFFVCVCRTAPTVPWKSCVCRDVP